MSGGALGQTRRSLRPCTFTVLPHACAGHGVPIMCFIWSGITLHFVFNQSQIFQILTKHISKTINNYETKYMQYENIFYDNFNNGFFIL
jgi:hypothetical protein